MKIVHMSKQQEGCCFLHVIMDEILLCSVVTLFLSSSFAVGETQDPIATLSSGKLQGKAVYTHHGEKSVYTFLGVPYAAPPVGRLRFLPPQPVRSWEGIRSAQEFSNHCHQFTGVVKKVYPLLPLPHDVTSEDCLYLNVYTSSLTAKNPVLLWIHGGSNKFGSGSQYDGTVLAALHDVVVVTINYRLGAFGFLSTLDDNMPGNAGLWDQRAAMKWVQRNIEEFGGDPRQVTIAGESTGGASVSVHVTSATNIGLFRRAISLSGSSLMLPKLHIDPIKDTQLLAEKLDCKSSNVQGMVDCLRTKSADKIIEASESLPFLYHFIVDGDMLSNNPTVLYKLRDYNRVDYMFGLASDEGYTFTSLLRNLGQDHIDYVSVKRHVMSLLEHYMSEPTDQVAQTIMDIYLGFTEDQSEEVLRKGVSLLTGHMMNSAPVVKAAQVHSAYVSNTFLFVFKHRPAYSQKPNWVIADRADLLTFIFGSVLSPRSGNEFNYNQDDLHISEVLMNYTVNFVKTGSPSSPSLPEWPSFSPGERYLLISPNVTVARRYEAELMNFWNEKFTSFISPMSEILHEEL